jgi:predicted acetyltransferase
VVFSSLYPFSQGFYRKFGYETACAANNVIIPTSEFSDLKLRGEFTQIFPGDDSTALNEILRSYITDINHAICRDHWPDNRGWNCVTQFDPYSTGIFTFLWRDEKGRPRAYIQYEDVVEKDEHLMKVWELAFTDPDALIGVLSIVNGLAAQFQNFKWLMPSFIDPGDFLNDVKETKQLWVHRAMSRVINVKAALEKMRTGGGEGAYIIETDDEMIPANKGRFLVEYGPEGSRVSLTQKAPQLHCDMQTLSQLITGYRSLGNALRTRPAGLEVFENRETLEKVFTQRPQHITEYF